jgi:multisubunit Na+/H+ antiporter MnhG subunit
MWQKIIGRIVRIIKFDQTVYKEIEEDTGANGEAAIVVVVASILSAIGAGIYRRNFGAFAFDLIVGVLFFWLLVSYVTMLIGTRLYKGETNFWEMARCIGYANAPRILGIFGAIPCIGWLASLAAIILTLVVAFFAIREALDLPTEKTLVSIALGWAISLVVWAVLAALF